MGHSNNFRENVETASMVLFLNPWTIIKTAVRVQKKLSQLISQRKS